MVDGISVTMLWMGLVRAAWRHKKRVTFEAAINLAITLIKLGRLAEAKSTIRGPLSDARRTLGDDNSLTLHLRAVLADILVRAGDLREAVTLREDILKRSRRLLGELHPATQRRQAGLDNVRELLARAEATPTP